MKLADTLDLGSSASRHGGSSPSRRTKHQIKKEPKGSFFIWRFALLEAFSLRWPAGRAPLRLLLLTKSSPGAFGAGMTSRRWSFRGWFILPPGFARRIALICLWDLLFLFWFGAKIIFLMLNFCARCFS